MDFLLFFLPSAALGLLGTAHVRLTAGLFGRGGKLRALLAFCVPPLAPAWGWQEKDRGWALAWVVALVLYVVTLAVATLS